MLRSCLKREQIDALLIPLIGMANDLCQLAGLAMAAIRVSFDSWGEWAVASPIIHTGESRSNAGVEAVVAQPPKPLDIVPANRLATE
jgi:hypothetical protein